jgi:hypothetical protein
LAAIRLPSLYELFSTYNLKAFDFRESTTMSVVRKFERHTQSSVQKIEQNEVGPLWNLPIVNRTQSPMAASRLLVGLSASFGDS